MIFLPMSNQLKNFRALVITTFVLKFLEVLTLILVQTSYDIFFIDWERPRVINAFTTTTMKSNNGTNKKRNIILPDQPFAKDSIRENESENQV